MVISYRLAIEYPISKKKKYDNRTALDPRTL